MDDSFGITSYIKNYDPRQRRKRRKRNGLSKSTGDVPNLIQLNSVVEMNHIQDGKNVNKLIRTNPIHLSNGHQIKTTQHQTPQNSRGNSAGESSAPSDDNDYDHVSKQQQKLQQKQNLKVQNKNLKNYDQLGSNRQLATEYSKTVIDKATGSTDLTVQCFKIHNKLLKNVVELSGNRPAAVKAIPPNNLNLQPLKDSGCSSYCSSLELSPDTMGSSQETYCSDIEGTLKRSDSGLPNGTSVFRMTQDTLSMTSSVGHLLSQCSSTLSQASTSSSIATTASIRSFSSCSERLPDSCDINLEEMKSRTLASVKSNTLKRSNPFSDNENATQSCRISDDVSPSLCKKSKTFSNDDDDILSPDLLPTINDKGVDNLSGENSSYGSCMMCLTQPKNGVFVHSRFLHLCCCYRCAVKVWNKRKRCPICNCKVKNVMKLFVH